MDLKTLQNLQSEVEVLLEKLEVEFVTPTVEMDESETVKIDLQPTKGTEEEEENVGLLIGPRGSTLLALEYIVALILNKDRDDWLRVAMDLDGYRKRREESLRELALKMADKAKFLNREVELKPMASKDRRVIHLTLSEAPQVSTESTGSGRSRRVVVKPL